MQLVIAIFAALMGLGLVGIWTMDIARNPDIDLSKGFFRARDKDSGNVFWFHWLAEYGTGLCLLTGAAGLLLERAWASDVLLLGCGALIYTAINSLGWVVAKPGRLAYGVPMLLGAVGGLAAAWILLMG